MTRRFHALAPAPLLCALLIAADCGADVYVWKDPKTGTTRMTNIRPPWLNGADSRPRTPRVEVIRGSGVLDPAAAAAPPQAQARPAQTSQAEKDVGPASAPGTKAPLEDTPLFPPIPFPGARQP